MIDEVEILFILTYEKKISSILEIQFIYKFINLISRSNASLKFSTHTLYSTHQIIKKKNSTYRLVIMVVVIIITTTTTTKTYHLLLLLLLLLLVVVLVLILLL